MLRQQDEIYAANARVGSRGESQATALEHVSLAELEQWESYHTELGCLYVELTQKHLQRYRKETGELDLAKVEASRTIQGLKKRMKVFLEKSDLYIAH